MEKIDVYENLVKEESNLAKLEKQHKFYLMQESEYESNLRSTGDPLLDFAKVVPFGVATYIISMPLSYYINEEPLILGSISFCAGLFIPRVTNRLQLKSVNRKLLANFNKQADSKAKIKIYKKQIQQEQK